MCKKNRPFNEGLNPLDTLAQSETRNFNESCLIKSNSEVYDDLSLNCSTSSDNTKSLTNRAKRKYLSYDLALGLVDVAKNKAASAIDFVNYNQAQEGQRAYWNMYHCASRVEVVNGKATSKYCKNRLCMVCNSIRTAVLIKSYEPIVEEWNEPYFVTLTAQTVNSDNLKARIDEMMLIVNKIQLTIKKRLQRSKLEPMKGLRKMECTYRPKTRKYHPHFHFIIDGKENAKEFLKMWLERTKHLGSKGTKEAGQDCKKADAGSLKELFKYFTKIVSNGETKDDRFIYLEPLHTIFQAIKGIRTFQSFGFSLPKIDNKELEKVENIDVNGKDEEEYFWVQDASDWVSYESGNCLSGYKVSEGMKELKNKMIKK